MAKHRQKKRNLKHLHYAYWTGELAIRISVTMVIIQGNSPSNAVCPDIQAATPQVMNQLFWPTAHNANFQGVMLKKKAPDGIRRHSGAPHRG